MSGKASAPHEEPSGAGAGRKALLRLPRFFLAFYAMAVAAFAYVTPPFQAPDEVSHILRAYQISEGHLVGSRVGANASGGAVEVGLTELMGTFLVYIWSDAPPVSPESYEQARRLAWMGLEVDADFRNTVQYSPAAYAPQAAGLLLGRSLGLPVLTSYYLARGLAALTVVLLGAAALSLAGGAGVYILAVLLLPMSVFLAASASQDGIVVALGALLAAILVRALDTSRREGAWLTWAAAACIGVLGLARLPYLALLPLLWIPAMQRGGRSGAAKHAPALAGTLLVLAVAGAWLVATAPVRVNVYPLDDKIVSASDQLRFLMEHPLHVLTVATNTLRAFWVEYARQFVGVLGWLNIDLPKWCYPLGLLALAATFVAARPMTGRSAADVGVVALTVAATAGGMFAAQYLTWTAVGAPLVEGMQGRYFLPLAPLLVVAVPHLPARIAAARPLLGLVGLGLLVPVILVAVEVLGVRYGG